MNALLRPLAILVAAAAGGAGLWLAGHWDTATNGGYWAMLGVAALVGLLLGLAQLRSLDTNPTAMLVLALAPIVVAAGWVLVFAQPGPNTYRDHVRAWSADLGIADVSHYLTPFVAVLALGIGLVFGLTLLAGWATSREPVAVEAAPASAPVTRITVPAAFVAASAEPEPAEEETVVATAPSSAPVTRMTVPAPFAAASAEPEPAEPETVVGNGTTRREILLVP